MRFPNFDCDGFSDLWSDLEKVLVAALQGPEGRSLLADLPNFAPDVSPILSVEPQILWPCGRPMTQTPGNIALPAGDVRPGRGCADTAGLSP